MGIGLSLLLAAVGLVALPVVFRILLSPWTLALLLPCLVFFLAVAVLLGPVAFGYFLDHNRPARKSASLKTARPLAFSTPAAWQAVLTRSQWTEKSPQSLKPLHPSSPMVSAAINEVLIMIVRDFVLVWYTQISASPSFPTAVSATLNTSLDRLLQRAAAMDHAALVVRRVLPKLTAHIERFRESEVTLRGAALERRLTASDELDMLLASRYAGKGRLHPAVGNLSSAFTKQTEEEHLKRLVERALPHILPDAEARSPAVCIVVREIVACSVLYPVVEMLSDPDFWNKMIDSLAGEAIRQQRLISKVRNVLESQSPRRNPQVPEAAVPTTETITLRTDVRQFESFLRSIGRISSLLDARRMKNDIDNEIRRTRALLSGHAKEDWINGEKTEVVVSFLDRLYTAKRKVDERIAVLGGGEGDASAHRDVTPLSRLTLRDVLTNPSSLSYLMEFMDRRNRSLLVQFWLTVESFKDPLASVGSDSSGEDEDALPHQSSGSSQTLKEDISMVNDLYFAGTTVHPTLSAISPKHVENIRSFVSANIPATPAKEAKARRSVMLAQRQVERDMEQDFEDFQRSDLWFRVIGDAAFSERKNAPALTHIKTTSQNVQPTSRPAARPSPRSPLPENPPETSLSMGSFGGLFGSPAPASQPSNTPVMTPSSSGYFSRPSPSKLDLLMSPTSDASSESRTPLFDDPTEEEVLAPEEAQLQRMEAIQAALTDIIALDEEHQEEERPPIRHARGSSAGSDILSPIRSSKDPKRRVLFNDELDHEPSRAADAEEAEVRSFREAGPGDLHLVHEIARLGSRLDALASQDSMLDALLRKAELTGDEQELGLLRRSRAACARERRALSFQKSQYEQQEQANRLVAERTRVAIVNATTAEESGKSVVRYLIEVQQLAPDGSFASGWIVARRYNEFLAMHTKLREHHSLVRGLDFPGKRLVTALSGSFVDTRRTALERYMQGVVAIPAVCESDELRAFLSRDSPFMAAESRVPSSKVPAGFPGQGLVRSVYKSMTESIDDMFFGPSMLDVIIQRLTRQAAEFVGIEGSGVNDEDLVARALKASGRSASEATLLRLPADLKPLEGETSTSTFSAPICDLLLEIFELDEKKNWLRRQAVVIILQQVFGETIERKLRETVSSLFTDTRLLSYIKSFRDGLWPGGQLKPPSVPRTAEEKVRTRDDANRKLSALIPDLAANMIGRSNARRGARRIFAVLQNRRLNQHIVYTVIDEVFAVLFPEP